MSLCSTNCVCSTSPSAGRRRGRPRAKGFEEIDARLRKAFRWLEKAVADLDGIKPSLNHRFDLGHGFVFDSPRFAHGYIGQHSSRIVGFPVLDEINIYYEIAAHQALTIEVAPGGVELGREEPRGGLAAVHVAARRGHGWHGAQVRLFSAAGDPGGGTVPRRLPRPEKCR